MIDKLKLHIDKLYVQILLSIISAFLLILSSAGFGYSFAVFIAFIPLLFALNSNKPYFIIIGMVTGFLYFVVCLSWMVITFGYFGGAPVVAAFGLLILISILGAFFFFVPFTFIYAKYTKNPIIISLVFVLLEAIKGTFFFGGVPWLNLAQSQFQNLFILQSVSVFGEYGLSFLIILLNIFIYNIITNYKLKKNYIITAIIILIMVMPSIYRYLFPIPVNDTKKIAVIQPGYSQEDKWDDNKRLAIINNIHMQLLSAYNENVDLIVLPESSYPARVLDTPIITDVLKLVSAKTPIILGTERRIKTEEDKIGKLYNTMVLIDKGYNLTFYDKRHLTPFGEYFPFITILRPVKEFFFGKGTMFSAGENPVLLTSSNNIKLGPVICFESAFSNLVRDNILLGANTLVVISNDTWFGKNQGRIQHLAVDTIRAVEYGRAISRATQDGISAFILPNGKTPLKQQNPQPDVLIYNVPLSDFRTFYSIFGNVWIAIIIPLLYYQIKRKYKE